MEKYTKRVSEYLNSFLSDEGYRLLKTEFVEEEHNYYLRAYIDLTEAEYEKRLQKLREAKQQEVSAGAEAAEEQNSKTADAEVENGNCENGGESAQPAETETAEEAALQTEEELPGVAIEDCVKVSRRLSKWLDKEDFIKEIYTLEVCSRGFLREEA